MRIVADFPRRVREIENAWIPLGDGTRLAARVWLPEDAHSDPVPAILEYLPYRKRDGTADRDEIIHPYIAGHGYACLRVDIRGSGESDGVLLDEYLRQEQDDALEVIAWIAAQPWCTGRVGMVGISWGGFNGLQVAARRPAALDAVITLCSTDDRYADDAHYMGGCLLTENMSWASVMFTNAPMPPDPALVGERWREMWRQRLEAHHTWLEPWLRHQRRDAYWKHGSIREDYGAIRCPVYAIGGWEDGYSNAVPRLLANLKVPRKGLIGPWGHKFAHFAKPAPQIGYLQETLRWWDQWLKGIDTGVMNEPPYRVWMQESVPPQSRHEHRPGRWVAEEVWPSPRIRELQLALNAGSLDERPDAETAVLVSSALSTGLDAGAWCGFGVDADAPSDQRGDDGRSLVFDSDPLQEPLEILGAPVVELELASDRPQAMIAVRLNDLRPDGDSLRVTYGLLNLTHRESHENPTPLDPGRRTKVRVQLNDIAHIFPAGHRIRVALSTAYWPIAWPSPEPVQLTVFTGSSLLKLPVRPPRAEDADLAPFGEPESSPDAVITALRPGSGSRIAEHDIGTGRRTLRIAKDFGADRFEAHGLEIEGSWSETYEIDDRDPLSALIETRWRAGIGRGSWQVRIETRMALSATRDSFRLAADFDAFENETRIFTRNWRHEIPRDEV